MKNKTDLNWNQIGKDINNSELNIFVPVQIGKTNCQNEFVIFVKPEMFLDKTEKQIENVLNLVNRKLKEYKVDISGAVGVGGKTLESLEIMNAHYGYINKLSRMASKILSDEDRQLAIRLSGENSNAQILGGHEYLTKHPEVTYEQLDKIWFQKKSSKLRSGFYVKGENGLILVNGFHPAQIAHFTEPSHRILLLLCHSDTEWSILRNEMIGATFPEKALATSIRGEFYADPKSFGLETVSIANNGVHMSAGSYEGLFEIQNFFGKILKSDIRKENPLLLHKMIEAGIDVETALKALENPKLKIEGKDTDLFSATEDFNSDQAVSFWKKHL